jgi:hypothetical protein
MFRRHTIIKRRDQGDSHNNPKSALQATSQNFSSGRQDQVTATQIKAQTFLP